MSSDIISKSTDPRAYGPAPWWAWCGELTYGKIDRDLQRFLEMEVYEVIIIPLYGLQHEYMGKDYLRLFTHACRRCREWGITLWIYDEFNWPSGTCAGQVLRRHPEARQKTICFDFPHGRRGKPTWRIAEYDGYDLAAYGSSWSLNSNGYLDVLSAQAVRHYLESTHEVYRRALGDYFQDVVVGFFTDEPMTLRGGNGLPYTPGLFDLFHTRFGYDPRPRLAGLVMDTPHAARLRRDYWELVAELFQVNYFRQYAEWCAAHGKQMTGHITGEEFLSSHVLNGDMFATLSEMQVPGTDMLLGMTSFDTSRSRVYTDALDINGKLIESVGLFSGKDRLICEAFGISSNNGTAHFYKRAADYLFHHGISMVNDNTFSDTAGSYHSGHGCHSFWTPWVHHYRELSRHVRTLSWLNAGARPVADIAVYNPRTDLWRRFTPDACSGRDADFAETQQTMQQLTRGLIRRHWAFYYVYEQVLERAERTPGGLQCGEMKCRVMILPDVDVLPESAAGAIEHLLKGGGHVICAGRAPRVLGKDGNPHPARWLKHARVRVVERGPCDVAEHALSALEQVGSRAVRISGSRTDSVMVTHRRARGGEWVFMTNFGEEPAEVKTNLDARWQPVPTRPGAWCGAFAGELFLRPGESVLLKRGARSGARKRGAERAEEAGMPLAKVWSFRMPQGNTMLLPVRIFRGRAGPSIPPDNDARWTAPCSASETPFPLTPGRTYWLRGKLCVEAPVRDLQLITDGHDCCEVFLDRRKVSGRSGRALWDDANLTFDLAPAGKGGEHTIWIRYTPSMDRKHVTRFWPLNVLSPIVLCGGFAARPAGPPDRPLILTAPPRQLPPGDLVSLGFTGLTGTAEYGSTFRLERVPRRVVLDLGAQNDTFEVRINGRSAGVLPWAPYRMDVTAWLKPGANRIVLRVWTAMGGILRRAYRTQETVRVPIGLLEIPRLYGAAGAIEKK